MWWVILTAVIIAVVAIAIVGFFGLPKPAPLSATNQNSNKNGLAVEPQLGIIPQPELDDKGTVLTVPPKPISTYLNNDIVAGQLKERPMGMLGDHLSAESPTETHAPSDAKPSVAPIGGVRDTGEIEPTTTNVTERMIDELPTERRDENSSPELRADPVEQSGTSTPLVEVGSKPINTSSETLIPNEPTVSEGEAQLASIADQMKSLARTFEAQNPILLKVAELLGGLEQRLKEQKDEVTWWLVYQTAHLTNVVNDRVANIPERINEQALSLKEIVEAQRAIEHLARQTANVIDRIQERNDSSDREVRQQVQLLDEHLNDDIGGLANKIGDQVRKFEELGLKFNGLGEEFDKLGLLGFLWDKKRELEFEAKTAVRKKFEHRLGFAQPGETPNQDLGKQAAGKGQPSEQEESLGSTPLIADVQRQFNALNVNAAPAEPGVYALHQNGELIYCGSTSGENETIRNRLQAHFHGEMNDETRAATHYQREITETRSDAVAREKQVLEEFQRLNDGRLPRCNAG